HFAVAVYESLNILLFRQRLVFTQAAAGMSNEVVHPAVRIPACRRGFKAAQRLHSSLFRLEPMKEARPGAKQCLVSDLDLGAAHGHEAPLFERAQDVLPFVVETRPGCHASNRASAFVDLGKRRKKYPTGGRVARFRNLSGKRALLYAGVEPANCSLGRVFDETEQLPDTVVVDFANSLLGLVLPPEALQRERQQRKRVLAAGVVHEDLDELRLDLDAIARGGLFDRLGEAIDRQWP